MHQRILLLGALLVSVEAGCASTLDFDGQAFVEADTNVEADSGSLLDASEDAVTDTGGAADTEQLFDARQDSSVEDTEPDAACEPRPEVCDGVDNDCDGLVDDADPTVVWDASNCGACGEDCGGAARAIGTCSSDWTCSVQRCSEAGYRDLNGLFADGCEFALSGPTHWLSRMEVSGFTQLSADLVVAWGDTGAQAYATGAGLVPTGAFGKREARVVSAEVVDGTLLLGMESLADGTGLIYRHPLSTPFAFDESATPVRLSRPPTDIASSVGRVLVSSAAPGAVQLFEASAGTYRFLGSVNPFSGADVLGLALQTDGLRGYAVGRDGGCRELVLSTTGTPIALGGGSVIGDGTLEAVAQASVMQSGGLVVAMLMRATGGGGSVVRLVSDSGGGPSATDVALGRADGVAIGASGGSFRVLHQDGAVSVVPAGGLGGVDAYAGPSGFTGARAFGPGSAAWLMANAVEVATASVSGSGVALQERSPVGLTPTGLVATDDGWLVAAGADGDWAVSQQPDGGLAIALERSGASGLVASGSDGSRFSLDAAGRLSGWVAGGAVTTTETGLSEVVGLEAGAGWLVALTAAGAFAQPYEVGAGSVTFDAAGTLLEGRFGSMAVDGARVALGSGQEVAWYNLAGGWQFGGRITVPTASAGVSGVRWSSPEQVSVMDSGVGLWNGSTTTGAQQGAVVASAAAGVRNDAQGGLFGRGGLLGWRSAERGFALWFAAPDGTTRLGTLDATRPGTSAYLQTPCGALAGDMSTASAAVVSDCGLTLWQHRAAP